jgi:hypothetical protein
VNQDVNETMAGVHRAGDGSVGHGAGRVERPGSLEGCRCRLSGSVICVQGVAPEHITVEAVTNVLNCVSRTQLGRPPPGDSGGLGRPNRHRGSHRTTVRDQYLPRRSGSLREPFDAPAMSAKSSSSFSAALVEPTQRHHKPHIRSETAGS